MSSRCWQGHVPTKVQEGWVGLGLPPSSQEFLSCGHITLTFMWLLYMRKNFSLDMVKRHKGLLSSSVC